MKIAPLVIALVAIASLAWVQPEKASIEARLSSADAATRSAAVREIREMLTREPQRTVESLRTKWLRQLADQREHAAVVDLAISGTLAMPQFAQTAEQLLRYRAESLLAMNRTQEAIAAAKSVYNVSTMTGLPDAVALMSKCLSRIESDALRRGARFRIEQVLRLDAARCKASDRGTLGEIRVPGADYSEQIDRRSGEWYGALLERGNLLLIADRVEEAEVCMRKALAKAPPDQKANAQHALARAIKAVDGGIGRANEFIRGLTDADAIANQARSNEP